MTEPRVFSIPVGVPFLPTLADALLDGTLTGSPLDGFALADATVLLPTRRAARAFGAVLNARGAAALAPRIVPLGDVGDDEEGDAGQGGPDETPSVSPLARRLVLARLVADFLSRTEPGGGGERPGQAVALAGDLEALMDAFETEDVAWDDLAGVVESEFSVHFRQTLEFLRIARENWPEILAGLGSDDPTRTRKRAMLDRAARLADASHAGPIVAAGSTGSVPATAALLAAIARLPNGAVVLPGLDTELDEAAWDAIGGTKARGKRNPEPVWGHPQFMLRRLLGTVGIAREAVRELGVPSSSASAVARRRFLSEAMRPADTTERWGDLLPFEREGLAKAGTDGIALIEAADEREEALAIAVALRETLDVAGRTAALVTPDRALARRVAVELGRWGVSVADSAPVPLTDTPAGRLARLAAEAAASGFAPLPVLALLAHPNVRLGSSRAAVVSAASALEIGTLRGPKPRPGLDGLQAGLEHRRARRNRHDPLPLQNLSDRDWTAAADLLERMERTFAGFPEPGSAGRLDLTGLASAHADVLRELMAGPDADRPPGASDETRGAAALFDFLDELAARPEAGAVQGRFEDYPVFFAALARGRSLPPETDGTHRRVRILGLLEARLLQVDRVVLGGLDEGIWPPKARSDAFLNRPMRAALGLSPPERRIGQTAHDFVEGLGTPDAILTRARKRDGKPTVPSRFLERMRSLAGPGVWAELSGQGGRYLGWAAALDGPRPVPPAARPAPRPGPERFPDSLSVTEIETLVRDPYAIYARHILRLSPLDPVGAPASLAERGTLIHAVLASFAAAHPDALPAAAEADLLKLGREKFEPLLSAFPELHALWWPDFTRIVPRYLDWEAERRARFSVRYLETRGRLEIPYGSGRTLAVRGTADRIELDDDGEAAIVDYKTGTLPSNRVVVVGFSPQLTLEAAALMDGGFADAPMPVGCPELLYVKLGGRAGLVEQSVEPPPGDNRSLAAIVEAHVRGLTQLATRYGVDGDGYGSRPFAQFAARGLSYDHLARVREWSAASPEPDGAPS